MSKMIFLVLIALSSAAFGQTPLADNKLDEAVKAKVAGFQGKVSLYARNLKNGKSFSLSGDQPVRTASTIKLAIMVECFAEAAAGKLDLNEHLKLTSDEKVSGSGILQDLSAGDELPIRDLIDLMIVLSDNTATNLILNRIGGDAVNTRMKQLGLQHTRVMRKILGDRNDLKPFPTGITHEGAKPENKKWGIGRSSPQEMVTLLERLCNGELINKASSDAMLAILKKQRDHDGIGRDLRDVTVANKTGALDHLRSDVGIVYSVGGPIAMAITVEDIPEIDWTPENPGQFLIARLSEILVSGLTVSNGSPLTNPSSATQ